MGYRKLKRDRLPPFVPLTWTLLNSSAYKKLTPSAAKALPYFLGKVKVKFNDPEKYEKIFHFSYPEANKLGFSSATFSRVTKEFAKIGFIEITEKGGLRGKSKGYNKYRLSKRWESYGQAKPSAWSLIRLVGADDTPKTRIPILKRRKIPSAKNIISGES